MQPLRDRLLRYVERHFDKTKEWPTIRMCARALRVPQGRIEAEAETAPFMLTSYFTQVPEPLGDHYVEILEGPC